LLKGANHEGESGGGRTSRKEAEEGTGKRHYHILGVWAAGGTEKRRGGRTRAPQTTALIALQNTRVDGEIDHNANNQLRIEFLRRTKGKDANLATGEGTIDDGRGEPGWKKRRGGIASEYGREIK